MCWYQQLLTFLNNTFIGTLFAGSLLAFFGLYLYHRQKNLDSQYARRQKIQELSMTLLTHINVSVKDYKGQINVYNGTNPVAKALLDKINSLSPEYFTKQNIDRFNQFAADINDSFNKLSTYLTLSAEYKDDLDLIAQKIPTLTFYFSAISALSSLGKGNLDDIEVNISKEHESIRLVLEKIINK